MNVVLDIDSTLIYALTSDVVYQTALKKYPNRFIPIQSQGLYLTKRRDLDEFLRYLENNHRIIIWTAGVADYADTVVKALNIKTDYIFSREHIILVREGDEDSWRKPLSFIYENVPGTNSNNTVMIDDRTDVLTEDTCNHIHVDPFELKIEPNGIKCDVTKLADGTKQFVLKKLSIHLENDTSLMDLIPIIECRLGNNQCDCPSYYPSTGY